MLAGFRIVKDTVAYRLRKLEMANMAAAISIAFALRGGNGFGDTFRSVFALDPGHCTACRLRVPAQRRRVPQQRLHRHRHRSEVRRQRRGEGALF